MVGPDDRADRGGTVTPPYWVGYTVTLILELVLTAILVLIAPVIELGRFPVTYFLLSMIIAYVFGAGPVVLSVVVGWILFTYFFVDPQHSLWPLAEGAREWAGHAAYLFGVTAVSIAAVQVRKSQRRIQNLADETAALNASLLREMEERSRAQDAARASEERFQTMVDSLPQLAWIAEPDGYIFWYNRRWYEYTGTTFEQVQGWNWQSVIDPELLAKVMERWKHSLDTGEPFEMAFPIRGADGRFRPFLTRAQPLKDAEGRVSRWFGTNTDVSELLETQEALRDSEARYSNLFATMREGFVLLEVITDDQGTPVDLRFLEANPALMANAELKPEETIGKRFREVLPEVEDYWLQTYFNVARTRQPARIEEYNKDLGRYFAVSAFSPGPGRVAVLFSDVTDRRRAEDEIRGLNTELEQRVRARTAELEATNKELEAFSYSVSHDLRAPLRAIDGFSNAILKQYLDSLDERGQDYLRRIRAAAQRMARLIDDILGLSRAGRAEMHWQRVDLSAMAADILDAYQREAPSRKAEISIEPGMVVEGDLHLLRIALDNLLSNAWKFTANREVTRVEVGSLEQDGERVYYVRDNGAGFDPAYADKLFSPFQRLHTEEEFAGTGIGLALVQRILRRHGGRIWAESAVEQGATFYFTLGEARQ